MGRAFTPARDVRVPPRLDLEGTLSSLPLKFIHFIEKCTTVQFSVSPKDARTQPTT